MLPARATPPSYSQGYAHSAGESAYPGLWRGLVGAWVPALGVTGGILRDASGFRNHGVLTNMAPSTDWQIGSNGYFLDFNVPQEHALISTTKSFDDLPTGNAMSIVCVGSFPLVDNGQIFRKGAGDISGWDLAVNTAGGLEFNIWGLADVYRSFSNNNVLDANMFTHIAIVHEGDLSINTPTFIDGALVLPGALNTGSGAYTSDSPLDGYLGGSSSTAGDGEASLSCVKLYNRALTASEIAIDSANFLAPFRLRRKITRKAAVGVPTFGSLGVTGTAAVALSGFTKAFGAVDVTGTADADIEAFIRLLGSLSATGMADVDMQAFVRALGSVGVTGTALVNLTNVISNIIFGQVLVEGQALGPSDFSGIVAEAEALVAVSGLSRAFGATDTFGQALVELVGRARSVSQMLAVLEAAVQVQAFVEAPVEVAVTGEATVAMQGFSRILGTGGA